MEFEELLKENIRLRKEKVSKGCSHDELHEVRIIYRKCKCCGKMLVQADEEWIQKRGVEGRGWYQG